MGYTAEKAAIVGSFGPATNAEAEEAARELGDAAPEIGLVEARLDAAEERLDLRALRTCFEGKKLIATLRSAAEGGRFRGSREEEHDTLAAALAAGFDFVDVEYRGGQNADLLGLDPAKVIVSCHELAGMPSPSSLSTKISAMASTGAAHVKYVASPRDSLEAVHLLELQRSDDTGRLTAFGMGEAGIATRALSPYLGAPLAYGSLQPGRGTAPGQIPAADLFEIYGVRKRRTVRRLYALFGGFVSHAFSPAIHNANFEVAGEDALYVPFAMRSLLAEFGPLVAALERLGLPLSGASVTIPFKEDAARVGLGEDLSSNTLVNAGGVFVASNTDRVAMEELIPPSRAGGSERALVLGAGGTARTAVEVLRGKGYDVAVWGRTAERARALAEDTGASVVPQSAMPSSSSSPSPLYSLSRQSPGGSPPGGSPVRVLVNATPLGLKADDPLPCPVELLAPGLLVLDAPYRPGGTALVKAAREAGAEVVDGYALLLAQAAGQAELFTRRPTSAQDLLNQLPPRLQPLFTFPEDSGGSPPRSQEEVPS